MLESSLLAPGKVLGNRYEIVRELGRGGFGRTYLALDGNKFNEKCAIKEFAPQVSAPAEIAKAKELFEREAGVLYKLQHPQIPAFRELLRVNGTSVGGEGLFLVQDYIEGKTYLDLLNQRLLQQQAFGEGEVIELLHHLLPVLQYIHQIGVIHRDITPDNIICRDRDKLPVPIDFGGVKEIAATVVSRYSNAKIGTRIGKQGYAPDEQMIRGKVSPASDLYAVGATVLTLLTGKEAKALYNPNDGKWEWQQYTQISVELSAILERLLQYRPQDRYQSAAEVLAVLPARSNYTLTYFPNPALPKHPKPISHPNQISQLKTIEISPRTPQAPPPTELPTRDPNEWKKPAWFATKLTIGALAIVLAINGAVKWVQSLDPIGAFKTQFDNTTASIAKSIPNPLPSQPPSVQQRQQDLSQQLKQKNIPATKFYRQVDREFYTKHPELKGRALTTKSEDEKLRQEWQDLAREILARR